VAAPSAEVLAQAALYITLRDQPKPSVGKITPWTTLPSRRFGGDVYQRLITLSTEDTSTPPIAVTVKALTDGRFDITVKGADYERTFSSVAGQMSSPTTVSSSLDSVSLKTTIVSQPPPPALPASASPNTMERLYVFHNGHKTTLVVPSPKWLQSLGGDVLNAQKGALKAPMPSLVVNVPVKPGDKVNKGDAVVILESMKTEMILRAPMAGVVKSVGCKKGEMVNEGKELVSIDEES
jgi:3-methylcrotonyl-CoA carboxylase alpha subunit